MAKRVLVPVADGTEEIETVCIVDTLRRAGAEVSMASVGSLEITASRGVRIVADCRLTDCHHGVFDLIALPGGMPGAEHLRSSAELRDLLIAQAAEGRYYAAICAAPAMVLLPLGLLDGRRATCHPSFLDRLDADCAVSDSVVVDGHCITSQGPGTALEFALTLVSLLYGERKAAEVAGPMITVLPQQGHS